MNNNSFAPRTPQESNALAHEALQLTAEYKFVIRHTYDLPDTECMAAAGITMWLMTNIYKRETIRDHAEYHAMYIWLLLLESEFQLTDGGDYHSRRTAAAMDSMIVEERNQRQFSHGFISDQLNPK